MRYVTYYRVSTQRQGRSGLGLDAQRAAVESFMDTNGPREEVASYTEIESGKHDDRPQLALAMRHCRKTKATLLVAKIDRLSRNASFLMRLRDEGVKFVAADLPDLNTLTLGIFASMAQYEREQISARTKAALAAARARGVKLGNPSLGTSARARHARKAAAAATVAFDHGMRHHLADARAAGCNTLRAVAAYLTEQGVPTRRGGEWTAMSILRWQRRRSR
jgi:DNA invertase Pin-like site-specific DNA recombinase